LKKIDLLLIKSFLGPFVVTFFIALFVLIMQFLWKYIDDMVGKGLETMVIAELIFYASATVVPLALPIAVLLSSIMTFGGMGEHYELVALKSAGISLSRFMRPLLAVSVALAIAGYMFSNFILPRANLKFAAMLYSVTKQRPALNIKEGVFYDGIPGYVIRIGRKDPGAKTVYDIKIHDHTEDRGNVNVLLAEKGEMYTIEDGKYLIFNLQNGVRYEEPRPAPGRRPEQQEFIRMQFDSYEMVMDLSNFSFEKTDENLFRNNHRMLNAGQILALADSMRHNDAARGAAMPKDLRIYFSFLSDSNLNKPVYQPPKPAAAPVIKKADSAKTALKTTPPPKKLLPDSLKKAYQSRLLQQQKSAQNSQKTTVKKGKNTQNAIAEPVVNLGKKGTVLPPDSEALAQTKAVQPPPEPPDTTAPTAFLSSLRLPVSKQVALVQQALVSVRNVKAFTNSQTRYRQTDRKKIARMMIEFHTRIVLALSCIALFLLGASLGAIIRKGGFGMPMVMGILFFILFYICLTMGKKLTEEMVVSAFTGMWLCIFVFFPLGLFLLYKANNDSQLLDTENYLARAKDLLKEINNRLPFTRNKTKSRAVT